MTADAALNPVTSKASAIELATTFLEDELARGPVDLNELKERAAARQIAWRTLQRARNELGIESASEGFGPGRATTWAMPAD